MVMTSWVLWVSGGHPHPRVRRVKHGDGTSVMVAPGKNHLKQKRSVSMALFLTQNLFVASAIDYLIYPTRPSHRGCNRCVPRAGSLGRRRLRIRTLLSKPQRLILLGLAIILLVPFGMVFWLLITHQPRSLAQRQTELEADLRERAQKGGMEDEGAMGVVSASSVEMVGYASTPSWVSFYPRRWVGMVGFIAIGVILIALVLSLFVRSDLEVSAEVSSVPRPPGKATP